MGSYAVVEIATGLVINTIVWDGIEEFPPFDGCLTIETSTASIGWTHVDGEFFPPPVVPPTAEEILAANTLMFNNLKGNASLAMTPLLLSLQLGDATDEETAAAKDWQAYSRRLKAVDLTAVNPDWPSIPAGN